MVGEENDTLIDVPNDDEPRKSAYPVTGCASDKYSAYNCSPHS